MPCSAAERNGHKMNKNDEIRSFIINSKYLCLGACDDSGNVWTCPLTYVADDELNIYFHSSPDSRHIEMIRDNPNVSFSIYDSTLMLGEVDGLQGSGIVGQLEADEVEKIHGMFFKKHIPDAEIRKMYAPPAVAFLSDTFPQKRFFKLMITELYKKDMELFNVFRRKEISLDSLK